MAAKQEIFKGTTYVQFVCQRCYRPLKIDPNLSSLDSDTLAELTAPLSPLPSKKEGSDNEALLPQDQIINEPQEEGSEDMVIRREILPERMQSVEGNGFTLIGDTQVIQSDSLSHKLKVATKLFDVMSEQSDIDHPLCEECTDTLLDQLDKQLKTTEEEFSSYKEFLHKLNEQQLAGDESLSKELEELQKEEADLIAQLEKVEEERKKVSEALENEKQTSRKLDDAEKAFYIEYCEYQRELLEFEDEQQSVENQMRYAQAQLDKLRKTNVFNSTFHIWHKGHFGTINNFRLGRLPSVPVEWSEINAAWGQTVLLLHSLARKMNLTFERYRLVPFGNHSYLESLSDKSRELPLYGSGGFRFLWDTKFDQAMVAFLDCLQQFKEAVEKVDKRFCLPYRMEKGKIYDSSGSGGAFSIKIQFNSEEQWTKALKFMLTNLKWGLAWVSSQFTDK
ncbi:beclin-1-like [Actinia tenebrosa]|uniref:Beclin-1-like n=1 Tax=Actinia tenebrosa TaxID=6105 RepID=A0A6P8J0G6_ACTTE|nr:beclin-1-like [Actinia tenebrosa]